MVKKRKGVKKNKGQRRIKKLVLNAETKKGILTVIFFVLAVISLLSFFGQAGIFGNYFLKFSQLLFGQAIFVIPVSFALLGTAVLTFRLGPSGESGGKEKSPHYGTIFWGVVLFIFSVLGIFTLSAPSLTAKPDWPPAAARAEDIWDWPPATR